MNIIHVVRNVTLRVPGLPPRQFITGEEVLPSSRYYYPLLWSGNATDSGLPAPEEPGEESASPMLAPPESLDRGDVGVYNPLTGLWEPRAIVSDLKGLRLAKRANLRSNPKMGPVYNEAVTVTLNQPIGNLGWANRQYNTVNMQTVADLGEGLIAASAGSLFSFSAFQYLPHSIRTICDGDKFAWYAAGSFGAASFKLYIEGRPLQLAPYTYTNVAQFHQLTFPSIKPGGRLVEIRTVDGIAALYAAKPYDLRKPPARKGSGRGLVIGDSYTSNIGATVAMNAAYYDLGPHIDCNDLWLDHQSGSGYSVTSSADGVTGGNTYRNRLEPINNNGLVWDITTINPDWVLTHGGFANDKFKGKTNAQCIAAGIEYYTTLRAKLPEARLIYMEGFAPPVYFSGFNPDYIAIRTGIQTALNAAGIKVYYVDVATTKPWIKGLGYIGAVNADNENSNVYISSDGAHPGDDGHLFIRARVGDALNTILSDDGSLAGTLIAA